MIIEQADDASNLREVRTRQRERLDSIVTRILDLSVQLPGAAGERRRAVVQELSVLNDAAGRLRDSLREAFTAIDGHTSLAMREDLPTTFLPPSPWGISR